MRSGRSRPTQYLRSEEGEFPTKLLPVYSHTTAVFFEKQTLCLCSQRFRVAYHPPQELRATPTIPVRDTRAFEVKKHHEAQVHLENRGRTKTYRDQK